ncbi:MAG: hypothetical protein KGR46_04870, partial [Verrucomicrobia bacterium]|nr:hypothetical protein [Verrucomicrobiota bacterium]
MPRKRKTKQPDQTIDASKKPDFYLFGLLWILLVLVTIRLTFIELSHGDDWADGSVLIAGENFNQIGFLESKGLPIFYPRAESVPPSVRPDKPEWTPLDVFGTYTRLPALFHWINGFFQRIGFSYDDLLPFRVVALALSILAVCIFYFFIFFISKSKRLSFICCFLYATNPFFISNFDSLHQNVYMDLLRNLSIFT